MTRDEILLLSLDNMIETAPEIGISSIPFMEIKKDVERIIKERDEAIRRWENGT
ncbi:MAG: hypothetical protein IKW45_05370 [Clostridia bacterium]|nr:hypothetical protein [Clostridia bacterium]